MLDSLLSLEKAGNTDPDHLDREKSEGVSIKLLHQPLKQEDIFLILNLNLNSGVACQFSGHTAINGI